MSASNTGDGAEDAVDQVGGDDSGGHEADRGDQTGRFAVRDPEDPVSAGAAVGDAGAGADQDAAEEHPDRLAEDAEAERPIEQAEVPGRRPTAGGDRGEEAAEHEAAEERQ